MLFNRTPPIALIIGNGWLRSDLVAELRGTGWLILEAANGEAALGRFGSAYFDVLFTDTAPGAKLSGRDIAATFRRKLPELAVAYSSANNPDARAGPFMLCFAGSLRA